MTEDDNYELGPVQRWVRERLEATDEDRRLQQEALLADLAADTPGVTREQVKSEVLLVSLMSQVTALREVVDELARLIDER